MSPREETMPDRTEAEEALAEWRAAQVRMGGLPEESEAWQRAAREADAAGGRYRRAGGDPESPSLEEPPDPETSITPPERDGQLYGG
jgi:hypothetical protein